MKRRSRLIALAAVFFVAVGAAFVGARLAQTGSSNGAKGAAFNKFAKGDPDASSQFKAGIANEGPGSTLEAQQEAQRAYPADSIPDGVAASSLSTYNGLKSKSGKGSWQSIGPNQAKYPALLDQFLAGGKEYTASGRVTALAIGGCKKTDKCSLYLGAAGGGVWVADKATDKNGQVNWQYKSASFGTNAIGALLVDPADPTGNTVYAGTGEPNASADSEAGLGIYKSTDGGDTWALVPGSDIFRDRAIGALAFDRTGNLLVGLTSAIRGVSSVSSGGAIGCITPTTPRVCTVRGLYRQTGATFTRIFTSAIGPWQSAASPRSSSTRGTRARSTRRRSSEGVWRSLDNGATWTQIKTALNPAVNDRPRAVRARQAARRHDAHVRRHRQCTARTTARFYRTDDAAGAAVFTDMTTPQNIGYCTGQCWYDNFVYSPPGRPERRLPRRLVLLRPAARRQQRPCSAAVDGRRRDLERHDPRPGRRRLAPSGPARARHRAGQAAPVDRRRRRRRRSLERPVRRRLGRLRQPSVSTASQPRVLPVAALADPGSVDAAEQGAADAAVPEPLGRSAASAEQPDGRHAGQRHVRVQGLERGLAADHLRRRRPVRLERGGQQRSASTRSPGRHPT